MNEQKPATPETSPTKSGTDRLLPKKDFSTNGPTDLQLPATPTKNKGSSVHLLKDEIFQGFDRPSTSQIENPHFSQFLEQSVEDDSDQVGPSFTAHGIPLEVEHMDISNDCQENITESIYPDVAQPSLSITRQEILTLTSVLERIPQEYLVGVEVGPNRSLPLMIVDEAESTPLLATSSQEDTSAQVVSDEISAVTQVENPVVIGKRRRPKCSLTGAMLKKQKFSATGPLDQDKTPYKWWRRVCKTELLLMS